MLEERKFGSIADREPVRTVEVGDYPRGVDVALIVLSRVKRSVAGRSSIDVLRACIRRLKVILATSPRYSPLQRVIDRVRVVGENLVAAVPVQSRRRGAGNRVRERVGRNCVGVAAGIADGERILGRVHRLDRVAGFPQVNSPGSDVSGFQNPMSTDRKSTRLN